VALPYRVINTLDGRPAGRLQVETVPWLPYRTEILGCLVVVKRVVIVVITGIGIIARKTIDDINAAVQYSDYYLERGDYLKLDNLSIG
jgi:hypothetical protein